MGLETVLVEVSDEWGIDLLAQGVAFYSQVSNESTDVLVLDKSYSVNLRASFLITQAGVAASRCGMTVLMMDVLFYALFEQLWLLPVAPNAGIHTNSKVLQLAKINYMEKINYIIIEKTY